MPQEGGRLNVYCDQLLTNQVNILEGLKPAPVCRVNLPDVNTQSYEQKHLETQSGTWSELICPSFCVCFTVMIHTKLNVKSIVLSRPLIYSNICVWGMSGSQKFK